MTRLIKGIACLALMASLVSNAHGFSLLGPFKDGPNFTDPWQGLTYSGLPSGIGYSLAGDIGGPMLPFEAYRWNTPIITYAFDFTFLRYFGTNGVAAVEEAIAILNALPPASQMSEDLSEYSLDTKTENSDAAALSLLDLKSVALRLIIEELGLANPERFVWGIRGRDVFPNVATNYTVTQLNFDPVTIQPSRYVNGVLYNYQILEPLGPAGGEWASAVEWYQLDPLRLPYTSVASGLGSPDFELGSSPGSLFGIVSGLNVGQFFTGLTRDDVGGLRFLLSTNHMVFDNLLPTVLPRTSVASSPWAPFISTNLLGTNQVGLSNIVTIVGTNQTNFVRTALRPGVDKITFQRVNLLGTNFAPITLRYTDRYLNLTTGRMMKQPVERLVLQPDILFAVRDLGTVGEVPVLTRRTETSGWTNNAALNSLLGSQDLGGPGTIIPPVTILFGDMVPYWFNLFVGGGDSATPIVLWGSFDGTSRPPVVYPIYQHPVAPQLSLDYLRRLATGRTRTN